jgi:hypothetical protein
LSRWTERDAERLRRRVRHLAVDQGRSPSDYEVAYLRRQTLLLLTDEAELPEPWRDDLRELEQILARIQRERQEVA